MIQYNFENHSTFDNDFAHQCNTDGFEASVEMKGLKMEGVSESPCRMILTPMNPERGNSGYAGWYAACARAIIVARSIARNSGRLDTPSIPAGRSALFVDGSERC